MTNNGQQVDASGAVRTYPHLQVSVPTTGECRGSTIVAATVVRWNCCRKCEG